MIQSLARITDDELYEVVNGERVVKPMGTYENVLAGDLHGHLRDYARASRNGRAAIEVLFDLPDMANDRRPDVSFVSFDRWPEARGIPQTNAWAVAPDLAVEVVSTNDDFRDVLGRVSEYFRAGVRLVWLVVPDEELVYSYTARTAVRIFARGDDLTGDPVVPGFRLAVNDLFPLPYTPDEIPEAAP